MPDPEPAAYFTVEEFRDRYPDLVEDDWSDEQVEAARALAEQAFEDVCGLAFVPRETTETITAPARDDGARRFGRRGLREITSATDAAGNDINVTGVKVLGSWATVSPSWPTGTVTVTYTHGKDEPPLRVKQAVMALARQWMIDGPVTARATQVATEGGGVINQATPGAFGSLFGLPEVDACAQIYGAAAVALA